MLVIDDPDTFCQTISGRSKCGIALVLFILVVMIIAPLRSPHCLAYNITACNVCQNHPLFFTLLSNSICHTHWTHSLVFFAAINTRPKNQCKTNETYSIFLYHACYKFSFWLLSINVYICYGVLVVWWLCVCRFEISSRHAFSGVKTLFSTITATLNTASP